MIDCLVFDRECIYASSEFTTGKRFYELCKQHGVNNTADLKAALGSAYERELLENNKEEGLVFARKLRSQLQGAIVLSPNPLALKEPNWTQPEYLGFWERVLRTKCRAIHFNEGWEYSNGCAQEFLIGIRSALPTYDYKGLRLTVDEGKSSIGSAVSELEADTFQVPNLRQVLAELDGLRAI